MRTDDYVQIAAPQDPSGKNFPRGRSLLNIKDPSLSSTRQ